MGLPGAGKTTLAVELKKCLDAADKKTIWLNADQVRKEYSDWDFSQEGRIRQSMRMYELSTRIECDYVIADFVAPLAEMRSNYSPDWTIWVDTISEGRFEDTNKMFIKPEIYDVRITEQDSVKWAKYIAECVLSNKHE